MKEEKINHIKNENNFYINNNFYSPSVDNTSKITNNFTMNNVFNRDEIIKRSLNFENKKEEVKEKVKPDTDTVFKEIVSKLNCESDDKDEEIGDFPNLTVICISLVLFMGILFYYYR